MKLFKDLNTEELTLVYENNRKLQEQVFDDMFETASFYCEEYLNCWKRGSIDYCIGWDRGTYFTAKDRRGFIDGLRQAQRSFCFLADRWNEKIDYVDKLICRLDNLVYWDYVNEERLNNRIDELIEELEDACYKRFMSEYESCFDNDYQLNYFLEFYSDARMDGDYYINDSYELFEHVEFERKFA